MVKGRKGRITNLSKIFRNRNEWKMAIEGCRSSYGKDDKELYNDQLNAPVFTRNLFFYLLLPYMFRAFF
jgi:hypothetical protein